MRIKIVKPSCNLNTIKDGRGGIFSYIPEAPIHEWTHQYIKAGKIRGNHSHPEFDEYIMLIDGAGVEVEKDPETNEENFVEMNRGTCIFIPRGTSHVFLAITDCESISFLTKKWDDCKNPIVHENLGHGDGDHGDPNSPFYKKL
jgi:oxalate decarboxylase/phosphoglucose isomerase-like protein (cupin superfamily)